MWVDSAEEATAAFAQSVVRGLAAHPRWLPCRYPSDARGSELFERITEQPEYYPTRTETALLAHHAREIRSVVGAPALVELGSGSSAKTRHLLHARVDEPAPYASADASRAARAAPCAAPARED